MFNFVFVFKDFIS